MTAGFLAVVRGPVFFGLAVAGLLVLSIPLLALFLAVLGLLELVGVFPGSGILVGVLLWAGDAFLVRYGLLISFRWTRELATVSRRLSDDWIGMPIDDPYLPPPSDHAGAFSGERFRWMVGDPATWRDLLWMGANATVGWMLAMLPFVVAAAGSIVCFGYATGVFGHHGRAGVQVPLALGGGALTVLAVWMGPILLQAYGGLARAALGPRGDPELARRVRHLAQTRSETIDASAAEIRRIERDLHDGAQARLVAMGMTLGVAEDLMDRDPVAARKLLVEAREASSKALAELRGLVSGIHPPVLADRGLVDAIRALALDSALRVEVTADPVARPPAPVESAAYFAVSELLTNVSKHADSRQAWVDIRSRDGMLAISVTDEGRGGADPEHGSGLQGIERRLAAFDGVLAVSSPPGGPTIVQLEIPCELSSPKTSSY
ncbi:MAG: histidine kinase [Acidimicrobiales bacterium]